MVTPTLVRKVEDFDDEETSDEDDLNTTRPRNRKSDSLQSLSGTRAVTISDEDTSGQSATERKPKALPQSEKVTWSDDEEPNAVYNNFKRRKTDARKKVAARTRKAKAAAAESTIVGRRSQTTIKLRNNSATLGRDGNAGVDSDDDDTPDVEVPQFLKDRRSEWEIHRQALGEAGLNLPPSYDDVDFSDDEKLQDLAERPILPKFTPRAPYEDIELRYSAGIIPAPIAQWLHEYQVKGAEFLHELFVYQKGGILGDDMGLGKTIQVIAFLTAAFGKTGDERDAKRMRKMRRMGDDRWYPRAIIVCPGSLMQNWKSELDTWGWWQVDVFHGSSTRRESTLDAAKQGRSEIVITTYTTLVNHLEELNAVSWDCVIADECHQLKNKDTALTKAMNAINSLCRIGLTGTAIQNNYDELWTLLNWTNPGKFGPLRAWRSSIAMPLKLGQSHDATVAQLAKARKTAKKLVTNLLPPFFLRRMKTLIADQLTKKSDRVVFCPLTKVQTEAYHNLVDSDLVDYIRTSADPCDCGSGKKSGSCCRRIIPDHGPWKNYVFPMLINLQKLSNHLTLLAPSSEDLPDKQEKDVEILQTALPDMWRNLYRNRDSIVDFANQDFCGKWQILKKLLRFWHQNGDKVLVFSHSKRLLRRLQMLFKATTTYNVSYLDGDMRYSDRTLAVDGFNADDKEFVFLISTRAGGVGLNIVSANKVVVFDPNWNPSYDLQAQDRAYRIGQKRNVEVFRLVSVGTLEEIIYARQIYKQQQANIAYNASLERRYFKGVQDEKKQKGEIFGLKNLFSFQYDDIVLKKIVNTTNIAESKAGVSVIGLDSPLADHDENNDTEANDDDDGDDDILGDGEKEEAALSQLAAQIKGEEIAKKRKKKKSSSASAKQQRTAGSGVTQIDAVAAILAGAGVEYTHENSEVIGSSRIETSLSKRAEENAIEGNNEFVFEKASQGASQMVYDPDDDHDHHPNEGDDHEMTDRLDATTNIKYRYKPPEHIRKRQFVSMAEAMGYENAVDFALVVESWTQEQRRNCLDRFYAQRRKNLRG